MSMTMIFTDFSFSFDRSSASLLVFFSLVLAALADLLALSEDMSSMRSS